MIDAIRRFLFAAARRVTSGRPCDEVIGATDNPYLKRWILLPRNRFWNIYVHRFLQSDDDRALHDHPWPSVSVLLDGQYLEHLPGGRTVLHGQGAIILRSAKSAHRIELTSGPVWTLFIIGPHVRDWGFLCPQGWRHWREFTSGDRGGRGGRGCS
ncbi:MAG: hypothetical protein PHZ23_15175 [Acidiphilium sp.]|nr:hypothetical protein [Acidiphilium sp.]